jgi:flagellin-like protein
MYRKIGKRGISPLIATVLLIAFAVAIATMIMNIGGGLIKNSGECKDVKMEVQTINGKPLFCYDVLNNNINVMLKNTGSVDIEKLKLIVTSADFSHEEKLIDNSAIKAGAIMTKNINYIRSGTFKVEIAPVISVSGKDQVCFPDTPVVAETIDRCN